MTWDPARYLSFRGERLRPAQDLLARVPLEAPARIADLGCGPGNATALLARRWPGAQIVGVDSAPAMLERARESGIEATWVEADLARWAPEEPLDLIYANAVFQWLDDHGRLFPRLMEFLRPGGALALQMPRNFDAPSHALMRETAASGPWAGRLRNLLRGAPVAPPSDYFAILNDHAAELDIWESEYLHVLEGHDPVLEWTRGTALRPVMDALPEADFDAFEAAYAGRLRQAYPRREDGTTLFPFRRLFIVVLAAV